MKNELPKKPLINERFIINLASSTAPEGTHWTAVRKTGPVAIYFDAFGMEPPIELLKYLKDCVIYYNNIQYQDLECIHCAHFSCLFLLVEKCLEFLPLVLRRVY